MKKVVILFLLIVAKSKLISSEYPSCWMFDFNNPSTMDQFAEANEGISKYNPMVLESYNDTVITPFRRDSKYYLTVGPYREWSTLNTKKKFSISLKTVILELALYQQMNNSYGYVSVSVGDIRNNSLPGYDDYLAFGGYGSLTANESTNGWTLFQNNHRQHRPQFIDGVILISAVMPKNNTIAIEYLRFYHPELTDENCVPRELVMTTNAATSTTNSATRTTEATTTTIKTTATDIVTYETTIFTNEYDTTLGTTHTTGVTNDIPSENPPCSKIDFNRPSQDTSDFQTCYGLYLPALTIKSYADTTVIPFRPYASHYLTNKWEGMSCMTSTSTNFSLDETSVINMALYFNFEAPGAWIEIHVVDGITGSSEMVLEIRNSSNTWRLLQGKITKTFENAKILIQTNMNSYSNFAIEYIDIQQTNNQKCNSESDVQPESTTQAFSTTTKQVASTTLESESPTETDNPEKFCSREEFDRIVDMLNKYKDECFSVDNTCS